VSGDRLIVFEDVSKFYGEVLGVNRVTLSLPPGITSLVGPNGSGKTTLMNLMTGLIRPTRGRLTVLGLHPDDTVPLGRRVGYCTQFDSFPRGVTGRSFIRGWLGLHGLAAGEADRLTDEALDRVGMMDAADRKIGAYSKGMRQRIKMAQAIVHNPELLILDEPLSGMDPLARRKTIRMIKEWGRAGRSVIVSSHILHEIESMTSNILLINQGRILAEGNVHQIRELIDEHPHTVHIRADHTRALAREFLGHDDVLSLKFEEGAVVVQTGRPDAFYSRLTELAASGVHGAIHEVTSPDDNLSAVFQYLVKS
jgi:ABC-2 type transport system ATP-binding protein